MMNNWTLKNTTVIQDEIELQVHKNNCKLTPIQMPQASLWNSWS